MKLGSKVAAMLLVLALAFAFATWIVRDAARRPNQVLSLRQSVAQTSADGAISFDIVNGGKSPIMCPDGWYVEFEDGVTTNLSLAASGNVRVSPGSTGTVLIPNPGTTKPWRLGASYNEEDAVFEVKVRIDQSQLKQLLPPGASSVHGETAVSEWIK